MDILEHGRQAITVLDITEGHVHNRATTVLCITLLYNRAARYCTLQKDTIELHSTGHKYDIIVYSNTGHTYDVIEQHSTVHYRTQ